jgi:hypothetical protein
MRNGHPFRLDDGGPFSYQGGVLHAAGLAVDRLAAAAGTPSYFRRPRRVGCAVEGSSDPRDYFITGHLHPRLRADLWPPA